MDVTIILPTLNEEHNIGSLTKNLLDAYKDISIIVSDDGSSDNTKNTVLSFQNQNILFLDRSIEKIHGLTASILEATKLVKTRYFIVMDADNQHPWEKIQEIRDSLKGGAKLVIASRLKVIFPRLILKRIITFVGNWLGRISLFLRRKSTASVDVLSGFFGVETFFWKKAVFEYKGYTQFRLKGYKILFDFLKVIPHNINIKNVHYNFNARGNGRSKSNIKIYLEYFRALML